MASMHSYDKLLALQMEMLNAALSGGTVEVYEGPMPRDNEKPGKRLLAVSIGKPALALIEKSRRDFIILCAPGALERLGTPGFYIAFSAKGEPLFSMPTGSMGFESDRRNPGDNSPPEVGDLIDMSPGLHFE